MNSPRSLPRRHFIARASRAVLAATVGPSAFAAAAAGAARHKVVVGAMPWVYASRPNRGITPLLPRIFADYEYAGI